MARERDRSWMATSLSLRRDVQLAVSSRTAHFMCARKEFTMQGAREFTQPGLDASLHAQRRCVAVP
jgi:hypothetical protein